MKPNNTIQLAAIAIIAFTLTVAWLTGSHSKSIVQQIHEKQRIEKQNIENLQYIKSVNTLINLLTSLKTTEIITIQTALTILEPFEEIDVNTHLINAYRIHAASVYLHMAKNPETLKAYTTWLKTNFENLTEMITFHKNTLVVPNIHKEQLTKEFNLFDLYSKTPENP